MDCCCLQRAPSLTAFLAFSRASFWLVGLARIDGSSKMQDLFGPKNPLGLITLRRGLKYLCEDLDVLK
jgi:hypothetical protein